MRRQMKGTVRRPLPLSAGASVNRGVFSLLLVKECERVCTELVVREGGYKMSSPFCKRGSSSL